MDSANSATVRVFDASGILVRSIEMSGSRAEISLKDICAGIYFVLHDGNKTIAKLVVTK